MLYQALQVNSDREQHYCRKVDKRFLEEINRRKPTDLQTIKGCGMAIILTITHITTLLGIDA